MKIEKLNEDKIKITLSMNDLLERNIDFHSFIYNSPETQDMFWDMIHEAEKEYGFNVDESVICVEASSNDSDTFTLIVTKNSVKHPSQSSLKNKIKNGNFKLKRKKTSMQFSNNIYSFESFDDICNFSKVIDSSKLESNSLYKMNDLYYLQVSYMPYNSIIEYSELVKFPDIMLAKLSEYGKLLIKNNAIQTIDAYFCKKLKKGIAKKLKKC